jgi:uncharacterized membrane protein YkvA (DUF1232 family)
MDRELDEYLEDFDITGEMDEELYQRHSHTVEQQFEEKLAHVGPKLRFAQDLLALFRYFRDRAVPWQKKALVVLALVYFISPLDSIPDLVPLIGYLDDLGVILAVTKFMSVELQPYYPAEGSPPSH